MAGDMVLSSESVYHAVRKDLLAIGRFSLALRPSRASLFRRAGGYG